MTTPTPPRRRWLQFGLRTMFVVVTIFALWLGWELKMVRERKEMRAWLEANGGGAWTAEWFNSHNPAAVQATARIPVWRLWLGDEPMAVLTIPNSVSEEAAESIKRQFPETPKAFIHQNSDPS